MTDRPRLRHHARSTWAATTLALGLLAGEADAAGSKSRKTDPPARDENAISHKPFAIASRGFTLQYERLLARRLSVLAGFGVRAAAREDFASRTTTWLGEGRYWLTGRDFASDYPGMAGPYLALAALGSRTSVENLESDRSLGAMWTVQESVRLGNRFVAWDLQEISVAVSWDVIHELDERGRLAPNTRATLGLDFTVGWVF